MDRKSQLMDSAEQLLRSRGYDGFSFADIAREIGIRTASIHYHFPSKADLALELMQRYTTNFETQLEQLDHQQLTAADTLAGLVELYRNALNRGSTTCLCVAFSISRAHLSKPVVDEMTRFRNAMLNWLTRLYKRGQEDGSLTTKTPKLQAAATLALLEGAQLIAHTEGNPRRFDNAVATLLT